MRGGTNAWSGRTPPTPRPSWPAGAAPRAFRSVATRWGDVRLKLRGWEGRVISAAPEYDDCLRLSRDHSVPIREVWAEANRLGEVYAGQKWEEIERGNS